MWTKYVFLILILFLLESCTNIYTSCLTKCQRRTDSCYLIIMNNVDTSSASQIGGFILCQYLETDCKKSCGSGSSSSTSSSRTSSSSSGSRSSSGGSSSSGGGGSSSGGSGGSSHEIIPPF